MLFRLLYPFHTTFSVLNVTGYITFRTAAASLTALAIGLALGPWCTKPYNGAECRGAWSASSMRWTAK